MLSYCSVRLQALSLLADVQLAPLLEARVPGASADCFGVTGLVVALAGAIIEGGASTFLLSTLRMKLQTGICPLSVLRFWGKNTMPYAGTMAHFTGIVRPLPVSRLPSEDQRKTGCNFILSVVTVMNVRQVYVAVVRGKVLGTKRKIRHTCWCAMLWAASVTSC